MKKKKNAIINNKLKFTLEECTFNLTFMFNDPNELFTIDESDPESARRREHVFSFVIFSDPIESWQFVSLVNLKTSPSFNFFSNNYSKVKN